jgi:hypothetical protein
MLAKKQLLYPRLKLSTIGYEQGPSSDLLDISVGHLPPEYAFDVEEKFLATYLQEPKERGSANSATEERPTRAVPAVSKDAALTDHQQAVVKEFITLTGVSDAARSQRLACALNWNLDRCIASYFDSGGLDQAIAQAMKLSPADKIAAGFSTLKVVYPDNVTLEVAGVFSASDTLWTIYQHAEQSGHVQQVGRALVFHIADQRLTDRDFDQTLESVGLFPSGTIRIAFS